MKLVPDWKSAWKMFSIQAMALGAALQAQLLFFPDALKNYLPDKWTHAIALFVFLTGAAARLVAQKKPDA